MDQEGNRNSKEATLSSILGLGEENKEVVSNFNDETLDSLVKVAMANIEESNISSKVNKIIECAELMGRPSNEIADCIHQFTGMKFTEAQEIYGEILEERSCKSNTLNKIYEKLG